jgi:hypothetical protein
VLNKRELIAKLHTSKAAKGDSGSFKIILGAQARRKAR